MATYGLSSAPSDPTIGAKRGAKGAEDRLSEHEVGVLRIAYYNLHRFSRKPNASGKGDDAVFLHQVECLIRKLAACVRTSVRLELLADQDLVDFVFCVDGLNANSRKAYFTTIVTVYKALLLDNRVVSPELKAKVAKARDFVDTWLVDSRRASYSYVLQRREAIADCVLSKPELSAFKRSALRRAVGRQLDAWCNGVVDDVDGAVGGGGGGDGEQQQQEAQSASKDGGTTRPKGNVGGGGGGGVQSCVYACLLCVCV